MLEWRVLYARNILRLEMLAEMFVSCGWLDTHGGEIGPDGKHYVFNRVHNIDGYGENDVPFAIGLFGARGDDDADAVSAYASALGCDRDNLDKAATRVQNIYRRRLGKWDKPSSPSSPSSPAGRKRRQSFNHEDGSFSHDEKPRRHSVSLNASELTQRAEPKAATPRETSERPKGFAGSRLSKMRPSEIEATPMAC